MRIRAERKLIMQNLNLNLKNDSPVEQKFPEYPLQNHTATDYNFFLSDVFANNLPNFALVGSFPF